MYESFLGVNPWTALFTLVNTLTVYFVARKYLFAPVTKLIESRQQEIGTLYADARKARADALAMQAQYAERLAQAREEGDRLIREHTALAHRREEEILRQASANADAIVEKANAAITLEKRRAINDAKDQICIISIAIAEKLLAQKLTVTDQHAMVDDFLDRLEDEL